MVFQPGNPLADAQNLRLKKAGFSVKTGPRRGTDFVSKRILQIKTTVDRRQAVAC